MHLTGTNGKTSVARMTAALLEAAGLWVGAYTSPHLQRVNERMAWNGEPVDDATLDELLVAVASVEDLLPDAAQLLRDPDRGRPALVRRRGGRRRGRRGGARREW